MEYYVHKKIPSSIPVLKLLYTLEFRCSNQRVELPYIYQWLLLNTQYVTEIFNRRRIR